MIGISHSCTHTHSHKSLLTSHPHSQTADKRSDGGAADVGRLLVTVPRAADTAPLRSILRGGGAPGAAPCIMLPLALLTIEESIVTMDKQQGPLALGQAIAASPRWPAAMQLLSRHLEDQGVSGVARRAAEGTMRFRASCVRDGKHEWGSIDVSECAVQCCHVACVWCAIAAAAACADG